MGAMSAAMGDDSPDPLNLPEQGYSASPSAEQEVVQAPRPAQSEPAFSPDIFGIPAPTEPQHPRRIPNLWHVVLFFVLALVLVAAGQLLVVFFLQLSHIFPHRSFDSLFLLSSTDARESIPIQAFSYGLIALVVIPVFSVLWH